MVGCRHDAKNTLVKNYLWFAERLGVRIDAQRTVTDVQPLGAVDGSEGYAVTHVASGALRRGRGETVSARGVVLAAGALGTNWLLAMSGWPFGWACGPGRWTHISALIGLACRPSRRRSLAVARSWRNST